jgi:hypothetical protein
VINLGIVTASLLMLALTGWVAVAAPAARGRIDAADGHRRTVDVLVATELAVIQAHGDELMSLAARGEDAGAYEHDYTTDGAQVARLLAADQGPAIADARSAYRDWLADHRTLVALETDPQQDNAANLQALALVTRPDADGSGAAFVRVDADLRSAISGEEASYRTAIRAAGSDLGGLALGAWLLAAAALACGGVGISRRLKEYR